MERKGKAGLYWAKKTDTRVHFLLDGIDMRKVVKKATVAYPPAHGIELDEFDTTASELRWLYRNRHDRHVRNLVQFWHQGKRATPPWKADPSLWRQYTPSAPNVLGFASPVTKALTTKMRDFFEW
ncbi:hypothetical protein BRY73_06770 [Ochrobactrum sp. P6BS-III]|nr:hypothetical protein BRY73_06770 [Ochrobactrum sp. P6BS-III]